LSPELTIAILAGVVALSSALVAVWGGLKSVRVASDMEQIKEQERRRLDLLKTTSKYREPLASAAFDLQSRIYNIIQQGFFNAYFTNGNERARLYAVVNTMFLFAQYFCWSEIIRRDIQFIDLGDDVKTRELKNRQLKIQRLIATDAFDLSMRFFSGEQRALGEKMIIGGNMGSDCVGYADFLDNIAYSELSMIVDLRNEIESFATDHLRASVRMRQLQSALIELIDLLDPDHVRFPQQDRRKLI
jgi:hypothetical protein